MNNFLLCLILRVLARILLDVGRLAGNFSNDELLAHELFRAASDIENGRNPSPPL